MFNLSSSLSSVNSFDDAPAAAVSPIIAENSDKSSETQNNTSTRKYLIGVNKKIVGKNGEDRLSYPNAFNAESKSLQEIAIHCGQKGNPWMPAVLDNGTVREKQNANHAEMLVLDIDEAMTIEDAKNHPFIAAHCGLGIETSGSRIVSEKNRDGHEKFRLAFVLPTPITKDYRGVCNHTEEYAPWKVIDICNHYLQTIIQSDESCKDACRFYFGSTGRQAFILNDSAFLPDTFVQEALEWYTEQERIAEEEYKEALGKRKLFSEQSDEERLALVEMALKCIPARTPGSGNYPEWMRITAAIVHELGESDAIWLIEKYSPSISGTSWDVQRKVKSFRKVTTSRPATLGTVFHIAKQYGFQFPAKPYDKEEWIREKLEIEYEIYCCTTDEADQLSFEDWKVARNQEWHNNWKENKQHPFNYLQKEKAELLERADIVLKAPYLPDTSLSIGKASIGLVSAKKTGKTDWITKQLNEIREQDKLEGRETKIFALTHRVFLGIDLANRLGLQWRNDAKKGSYGTQLASCIEGLMSVDTALDVLVVDETVQVVRHLLTSDTAQPYRPLFMSKVKELFQNARQIICADADLDQPTIDFVERISGKKLQLVVNRFVPTGYKAFFSSSDESICQFERLVKHIKENKPKGTIFIASDNAKLTKKNGKTLEHLIPGLKVLIINSKTCKGVYQQEFINNQKAVIDSGKWDVIIASPSLATGVSLKSLNFDSVWGFFTGKSINAADMAQALMRVRMNCDRFIWCSEKGTFWKYGNTTQSSEVRSILEERSNKETEAAKGELVQSLAEDFRQLEFNWKDSPFVDMFCQFVATNNRASHNLRTELIMRLALEGNTIDFLDEEITTETLEIENDLAAIGQQIKIDEDTATVEAADYDRKKVEELQKNRDKVTEADEIAIKKFYLKEFYAPKMVDEYLIKFDNDGKTRNAIKRLENLLNPEVASKRSTKNLINSARLVHPDLPGYSFAAEENSLWDVKGIKCERELRISLGLMDFVAPENAAKVWTVEDYQPYAEKALAAKDEIKKILGLTISEKQTEVQIVNALLRQICIKMHSKQKRVDEKVVRLYSRDAYEVDFLNGILERRAAKMEQGT